jgi:hypothetical protein
MTILEVETFVVNQKNKEKQWHYGRNLLNT